jgi:hypothetical protein
MQSPASKDLPRSATIIYHSIRSATTAKYVVHAAPIQTSPTSSSILHILYCDRVSSINYFREFISSHPRVFIPIIIALLTTTSLILFDPIREFNIEHKIRGSGAGGSWIRWLKRETYARLGFDVQRVVDTGIERDRDEARLKIQSWLRDVPDTFVIVSGAKGSGKEKEALIDEALHDRDNVLIIDLGRIGQVVEAKLISEVAASLGYWPQFAALSSLNNLIDLASIGLIGQKAGFSSDTATQLKGVSQFVARSRYFDRALTWASNRYSNWRQRPLNPSRKKRSSIRNDWLIWTNTTDQLPQNAKDSWKQQRPQAFEMAVSIRWQVMELYLNLVSGSRTLSTCQSLRSPPFPISTATF